MRADTANRSFAGLVGASLLAAMLVFCAALGCVLVALLASRLARHGMDGLTGEGQAVWPALGFIAVVAAGAVFGAASLWRQFRASQALSRRMQALERPLPSALAQAARRAGLGGRITLVDCDERFSFAYGAVTPRVAVSSGLLKAASREELNAVLAHERYHVRNLDPLKVVLARALPESFFYMPALRSLRARYLAARELAADRRAVEACGPKPLAGALFKVLRGPSWPELRVAAAIGGPELIDARVAQLESGSEPPVATVTARAVLVSLLGVLALTALFVASVIGFGGPSAVADATGSRIEPLDAAGAVLCAIPWAVGGWLGYRWLVRRTHRPLDIAK